MVLLRGLGQLALLETATGGALVLLAIALINPWNALGAVAGTLLGTLAGYRYTGVTREEWHSGVAGFNGAVIGIMAAGFVTTDNDWAGTVSLAAALCLGFEYAMRPVLARWALPVLSMPAVLSLILTSLIVAPPGTWLWVSPGPPALGGTGIALAMVCIVLALAGKSLPATLQLVFLACVAILACRWWGADPLSVTGLWAFTIAPASFTVHAVFMRGSLLGGVAGGVAAAIGAGIWILWTTSGMGDISPPLLAPFIIGVWCALLIFRRLGQPVILLPAFWRALAVMVKARLMGKPVVVIISDTQNLDSQAALSSPEFEAVPNFVGSRKARRARWQRCHELREHHEQLTPMPIHNELEHLQRRHWLEILITFAMDGRLQRAGAKHVVEVRGRPATVRCLGCRIEREWPPANIWRRRDLHCSECGDLMLPGPPGWEEAIDSARLAISRSLDRQGVLMVIGTLEEPRAARVLFGAARRRGARIINITAGPSSTPLHAGEILVHGDTCSILAGFARMLIPLSLSGRLPGIRLMHARLGNGRDLS